MGLTVHAELGFSRLTDPFVLQGQKHRTQPKQTHILVLLEHFTKMSRTSNGQLGAWSMASYVPIPPDM
jgi:hypothetical protein